jgi:hypothetical protein
MVGIPASFVMVVAQMFVQYCAQNHAYADNNMVAHLWGLVHQITGGIVWRVCFILIVFRASVAT